jgi:CBS domain containing-hemolysin-like protein
MTENPVVVAVATVLIIALSAFFVAVEFALIAARRHRLEDSAPNSRSARAALRSANELTVLLAGSQLGITVCTLALGAITKPAVHHWLTPLLADWGLAAWVADAAGFVLALVVVTFLHLVVGEMAPKSWAIAHPERSATLLAIPMRGFMWLTRPLLEWMNDAANWCLRRVGVEATESLSSGQDSAALRHLVEHSANVGALDASYSRSITGALELETMTLGDIVRRAPLVVVPSTGTVADVQAQSQRSGHLRILVDRAPGGATPELDLLGTVHVRDTLNQPGATPVAGLVRPVPRFDGATTVYDALARMRREASHLVLVVEDEQVVGVITMADLLHRLFPVAQTAAG